MQEATAAFPFLDPEVLLSQLNATMQQLLWDAADPIAALALVSPFQAIEEMVMQVGCIKGGGLGGGIAAAGGLA